MPDPDLMERTHHLVTRLGRKWTEIASILEGEGYAESGQPLNPNTIRKRYGRWLGSRGDQDEKPVGRHKDAVMTKAKSREALPPTPEETGRKDDMMISGREVLELLQRSMERRDGMLLAQIRREQDKEYDDLREHRLEVRLDEKVGAEIEEVVPRVVREQLRAMQEEGSSFTQGLKDFVSKIVEQKMAQHLSSLLEGIEIKERGAGPGRGHKGSTTAKFSATIPAELHDEMKSLGGVFSGHLAAACRLYLRARGQGPNAKE